MSTWRPAALEQVKVSFADAFKALNAEDAERLVSWGIGFRLFPIKRSLSIEQVYVIVKNEKFVIFYDDIEDGWEVGSIERTGIIAEYGASEWSLSEAIRYFFEKISEQGAAANP